MNRSVLILAAAVALALATALAACGQKRTTTAAPAAEPLDLMLDYFPNADHVGIYAAISNGDFRRAGLDVRPRVPSDPAAPLKLLAAGRADLVISYEPELLLARDKGAKLVSVGAIVQKPLTSLMALGDADIDSVADLRGKRVGTAGIPYQAAYLRTILEQARVNPASVRQVDLGFNLVPAMLGKRVDATLGAFWNYEGVELAQRRRNPTILRMERLGVPTYNELIVVAREADLRERGGRVRRFMRGLTAGYETARRAPAAAVNPLLRANPDLKRPLQLAVVRTTLPVFFPASPRRPFGWQEPREWFAYGAWMLREQLLRRPPDVRRAFTNEFLVGEGG